MGTQASSSSTAVVQVQAQEERTTALDVRLASLEQLCNKQAHAAVLSDIRAQDFEQRIEEAEVRMGDLELIRVYELRDERDERVAALESASAILEEWRPFVDGTLDDVRLELRRLKQRVDRSLLDSGSAPPGMEISVDREPIAARPFAAGFEISWPNGHRSAPSAWERDHGSPLTQIPNPNNGKPTAPPRQMQLIPCSQPCVAMNRPPDPPPPTSKNHYHRPVPPPPPIPPNTIVHLILFTLIFSHLFPHQLQIIRSNPTPPSSIRLILIPVLRNQSPPLLSSIPTSYILNQLLPITILTTLYPQPIFPILLYPMISTLAVSLK